MERVLVVASYPPLPGAGPHAALAAVRRLYEDGYDPVVVSARPTAAHLWAPVVGLDAGGEIDRVRKVVVADRLLLGLEAGVPFTVGASRRRQQEEVALLIRVLGRFRHISAVVTGDLGVDPASLAPLWRYVDQVVVPTSAAAAEIAERWGIDVDKISVDGRGGAESFFVVPGR